MAQVFGLKCGLPKELQFIGSILEDSDGIGIVNMPRQVRVTSRQSKNGSMSGDGSTERQGKKVDDSHI